MLFTVVLLALQVLACTADQVSDYDEGVIDWLKPLTGIPRTDSINLAPRFHRRHDETGSESYIVYGSKTNIVAAVNPIDGSIAWRDQYEKNDQIVNIKTHKDNAFVLSGPGGSKLRSYSVKNGTLDWEVKLGDPTSVVLHEPADVGTHIAVTAGILLDPIVLTESSTVTRLNRTSGEVVWRWKSAGDVSSTLQSRVYITNSSAIVVGLTKSFASYTLHATFLDIKTGEEKASKHVPGSIKNGLQDVIFLDVPGRPHVAWLEAGKIHCRNLLKDETVVAEGKGYRSIVDVGLALQGLLVGTLTNGRATVFALVGLEAKITPMETFPALSEDSATYPRVFSGGLDKFSRPYVSRVWYSTSLKVSGINLYVPHANNGSGTITNVPVPFDAANHGAIVHVSLDVAEPETDRYLTRITTTTTTGAIQLWQGDLLQWTREESLSELVAVQFVDLPEEPLVGGRILHQVASFVAFLIIQTKKLKDVPPLVGKGIMYFIMGGEGPAPQDGFPQQFLATNHLPKENLVPTFRDQFGFRKLIVVVTSTGKAFGISTAYGIITWSRVIGMQGAGELGFKNPRLFTIQSVLEGHPHPILAYVLDMVDGSGTAVMQLDPFSGLALGDANTAVTVYNFVATQAFLYQDPTTLQRSVVIGDAGDTIVFHNLPGNKVSFNVEETPMLHFVGVNKTSGDVTGKVIPTRPLVVKGGVGVTVSAWELSFGTEETILYSFRPSGGPVASLGKVLANRTTLYKYLNSHVLGLVTKDLEQKTTNVYLFDSVTGNTLFERRIPLLTDVAAVMEENWLIMSYFNDGDEGSKGPTIVSIELYEGDADEKTKSSETSSWTAESTQYSTKENSFVLPASIKAVAFTRTKYGISNKDLLVATAKNQLQSVPRRLLDPRRHKDKPSTADNEELLIPYDPTIVEQPQRVLSHRYTILGVEHIETSPSLLESTSLIFAYGHDLYFTRIAPSGTFDLLSDKFNKVQLALIATGLTTALLLIQPIVRAKLLRQQWYTSSSSPSK